MDSEEEAFDPWPGAILSETGCHTEQYYEDVYKIAPAIISFFKLDQKKRYSMRDIEKLILDYAEANNGFVSEMTIYRTKRKGIKYDRTLWKLLEIPDHIEFKMYHFYKILKKLCVYDPKPKVCGTYLEDLEDIETDKFKSIISTCLQKNNKIQS